MMKFRRKDHERAHPAGAAEIPEKRSVAPFSILPTVGRNG
jgi:hypothetical protein